MSLGTRFRFAYVSLGRNEATGLEVGEEFRLDDESYSQAIVKSVVVKHAFAVAVVVLNEEVLILVFGEFPVEYYKRIEVEVPTLAFGEHDVPTETLVGRSDCHAALEDT